MEIPLFPLPNLVLFPQVAVPLHIFEERYKLMINRCIDQADVFGLVLLNEEAEQENEENILRVGVTARVVQVDRLDEGRLNILCAGESRFRILEFTGSAPYREILALTLHPRFLVRLMSELVRAASPFARTEF